MRINEIGLDKIRTLMHRTYSTQYLTITSLTTQGCPGVLVVKRAVLPPQNSLPTEPGGGTVFYVTEDHHR